MACEENRCERNEQALLMYHILSYLAEHPNASDTLAGVLRFWIPECAQHAGEARVESALDTLHEQGWLAARWSYSHGNSYGLNNARLVEAQRLFGASGRGGECRRRRS